MQPGAAAISLPEDEASSGRRRKPGARRLQILQTLATMLEDPKGEKVTTAALAAQLGVSEAALYRHFASKAQMFEGLIEFIETTIFGLINEISTKETSGLRQARRIVQMLLDFVASVRSAGQMHREWHNVGLPPAVLGSVEEHVD